MDTNTLGITGAKSGDSNSVKPLLKKRFNLVLPMFLYDATLNVCKPHGITFTSACKMGLQILIMLKMGRVKLVYKPTNEEVELLW